MIFQGQVDGQSNASLGPKSPTLAVVSPHQKTGCWDFIWKKHLFSSPDKGLREPETWFRYCVCDSFVAEQYSVTAHLAGRKLYQTHLLFLLQVVFCSVALHANCVAVFWAVWIMHHWNCHWLFWLQEESNYIDFVAVSLFAKNLT